MLRPAEQVQVDVEHRLPGVAVRVEHGAVAAAGDSPLLRDRRRAPHHLADDLIVAGLEVVQRLDVALGHDEHVRRRLRIDVVEGEHAHRPRRRSTRGSRG